MKKRKIFNETFFAILEMCILAVGIGCAYLLGHYDSLRYQEIINEKLSNCLEVCNYYLPKSSSYMDKLPINFTILKNSSGNNPLEHFR